MDASVNRIPASRDERALLLSLRLPGDHEQDISVSLEELRLLVGTAGAIVAGERVVNRKKIDPSFIIGKGFLEELHQIIEDDKIKVIIFDMNTIRPAQVRNLEEHLKCRVIGRTEIILEIFARRARSSEAKIQVELAQLNYILPRLKGLGGVLSRLGGGIGTRGPGETMLETDRRHVLRRIDVLRKKLKKIEAHRERIRKQRLRVARGAVVGYTNAGKSTLVNNLAGDDLFVENRLFATLDAYTRSVFLAPGEKVLLTDTVGFIRNLPAGLIQSFRSTLEEIVNASFILHVVDMSNPDIEGVIATVHDELRELQCLDMPSILFFNKSDLVKQEGLEERFKLEYPGSLSGSARTGEGIEELKQKMLEFSSIT